MSKGKCLAGLALGAAPVLAMEVVGPMMLGALMGADEAPSKTPPKPVVTVGHHHKHTSFWAALAGAVVGALVAAAITVAAVAIIGVTGGLAVAAVGILATLAFSAVISAAQSAVTDAINSMLPCDDGPASTGSPNVSAEGKPVARAGVDIVACVKHSPPPLIAQGSETVAVNEEPMVRVDDKSACGATFKQGCTTVIAGTGQATVVEIEEELPRWQRALIIGVEFLMPPSKGLVKRLGQAISRGVRNLPKALSGFGRNMARSGSMGSMLRGAGARIGGAWKGALAGVCAIGRAKYDDFTARVRCSKCAKGPFSWFKKALFGDPIDAATGAVVDQREDFAIGNSLVIRFERHYNSQLNTSGWLGRGWTTSFSDYLELAHEEEQITYHGPDGRAIPFDLPHTADMGFNRHAPHLTLRRHDEGYSLYNHQDGQNLYFVRVGQQRALLNAITDEHGNNARFAFDRKNRPIGLRHSDGIQLRFEYDGQNCLRRVQRVDAAHAHTLAEYKVEQGLLREANATEGHHFHYEYDNHKRLSRWSDLSHTWVIYQYDRQGRCIASAGSQGFYRVQLHYDTDKKRTRAIDSQGRITDFYFDDEQQLIAKVEPGNAVTRYAYNEYGQLIEETDPLGNTEQYEYDTHTGLMLSHTDAAGQSTAYEYDDQLRLSALTDALGQTWRYDYNARNALTHLSRPDGQTEHYRYDNQGNLIAILRNDGAQQTFQYDERQRLKEWSDWNQARYLYRYDSQDRLISILDPEFREQSHTYDARGLLASIRLPGGGVQRFGYDAERNLIEQKDEMGRGAHAQYGAFDLLYTHTDAEGRTYRYAYDTDQLLPGKVTAPDGREYRFERDHAGRVLREINYAGGETHYTYDLAGQLSAKQDPMGQTVRYQHDANGAVTDIETDDSRIQYQYDALGRLVQAQNAHSILTWQYDALGRVVQTTQNGQAIDYEYDASGYCHQRTLQAGPWHKAPHKTQYRRDANGELCGLDIDKESLDITRDQLGRDRERRGQHGFILQQNYTQAGPLAAQRAGYNSQYGLQSPNHAEPTIGVVIREYGYNRANDLEKVNDDHWGITDYQHDRSARLVGAANQTHGAEQFSYDRIGQIQQRHHQPGDYHRGGLESNLFSYNVQGLPEQAGPCQYAYDQNGRVIRKTVHRKGFRPKTWRYAWNALDQLTRVTTPTGEEWQYAYDPLGRRINKYNPQTHTSHHYIWDGDVILQEITLTGEGEAQQTNITTWHHEGFTPLIKEQQGQVYHVITDPVGTPKELLTAEGELAWSGYHRTWGQLYQTHYGRREYQTGCPIRYPGQYEDAESGLHYNRFRYYDPDIGQYLSPDPIGLEGGLQPHAYVPNPNGWMDPLGLARCKPTKYHKRTVREVEKLRHTFDKSGGVRSKYLKSLSKQPDAVAKYGEKNVALMSQGKVPDNMVVHHKKPLFRGGNNKYSNLTLMDKATHSKLNKQLHWYEEGLNPYGLN